MRPPLHLLLHYTTISTGWLSQHGCHCIINTAQWWAKWRQQLHSSRGTSSVIPVPFQTEELGQLTRVSTSLRATSPFKFQQILQISFLFTSYIISINNFSTILPVGSGFWGADHPPRNKAVIFFSTTVFFFFYELYGDLHQQTHHYKLSLARQIMGGMGHRLF